MFLCNVAFTYYSHCTMCHSYTRTVTGWIKIMQFRYKIFLGNFLTYKCWWWQCHICWVSLKQYHTQEMAPLGMESNGITQWLWDWRNRVVVLCKKDAPCIIHCAGRREKTIQQLWYLVLWEQLLLSNRVHVFAIMSKLGQLFFKLATPWHILIHIY